MCIPTKIKPNVINLKTCRRTTSLQMAMKYKLKYPNYSQCELNTNHDSTKKLNKCFEDLDMPHDPYKKCIAKFDMHHDHQDYDAIVFAIMNYNK